MSNRDHRAESIIHHRVGAFLSEIREPDTLVTVTRVEVAEHGKSAKIFITVFPETREAEMLKKMKRGRSNLRNYVKANERLLTVPLFDFAIDRGEKNRQHIEEISGKIV